VMQAIVLGNKELRYLAQSFNVGFGRDVDHVSQ
jgi:hypothetical protein